MRAAEVICWEYSGRLQVATEADAGIAIAHLALLSATSAHVNFAGTRLAHDFGDVALVDAATRHDDDAPLGLVN